MSREEELLKKIKELEDKLKSCRAREKEVELLLQEYSDIVKRQFEMFDNFVKDIGTKRIIDPLTRVYTKEHIMKLITYYHSKAFEENCGYAVIAVRIVNLDDMMPLERESQLVLLGKVIRDSVRVPLDSIGRYSDDTFMILLTDVKKEIAKKVLERIKDAINLNMGDDVKIKTSLRAYPEDGLNLEENLKQIVKEVK
ncbi:MAG: diguanylate cyclase [Thermotogaceae bacterium]|nr:diguanylate cyclase [Thermotogaceae bacterium]